MMDGRGRAAVDAVRRGARTASAAVSDGWREASTHMSGRVVSAGVASLLIGIVVLGASTSSAQRLPVPDAAQAAPAALVAPVADRAARIVPPAAPAGASPAAPVAATRQLAPALPSGPLGIPGIAMKAYKLAADRIGSENPGCKMPWYLLAGIGRIESDHAGNGNVDSSGTTLTPILGPVLDGSNAGDAVITDTDKGAIDGDPVHDRAVGPMQFIPSTWAAWGADANGDGKADPNNLFDAAYSAARYLCAGVSDVMSPVHRVSSVLRYNQSLPYATEVLAWAIGYATGAVPTTPVSGLPAPPATPVRPAAPVRPGVPAPAPGAPGAPTAPGATDAAVRFTAVGTKFTTGGTLAVTSPAGPVECSVDLTGTVAADGTTATISAATLRGANPLCGIARTVALPWTVTPTGSKAVEITGLAVDALGTRCGPASLSGDPAGPLTAARATAPCVVTTLTLRPTPALATA
ncbi:Membrane-bound lytic murein transglycosylase B [Williamsia serinedens]|uniref:Membrane-bound lytic murein transglycosylase B n=2 Tax=Williamsia serinedens TaxID=391736 RepID=A0ABT1H7P6_9NOCA|nr:Membrane-bound lytic murein transglycosylase B [Williamsia serinedens]